MEILCFFAGTAFFYTKNGLLLVFLVSIMVFRPRLAWLLWFVVALGWSACHQWWVSPHGMPVTSLIEQANLAGFITSIPIKTAIKTQFQFHVTRCNGRPVKATVQLSCYKQCPNLSVGQFYHVKAKLQQPRNLANPGGFDYVSWLHARHLQWTGSVRGRTFIREKIYDHSYPLLLMRQRIADSLANRNHDEKTLGIIEALTLGITTHIDKVLWDLFRRTGTTHLMVISGAHIGLVSGLFYGLMKWLWRMGGPICLWIPATRVASVVALVMALAYTLLAGFAVPAQRSLLAGFFILLRHLGRHRLSVWQSWRYALLLVLLIEPHAVLLPGFYLSFVAVAILFLITQCVPVKGFRKTLVLQLGCLFGLMPLTLFWFSYGAVNGLVANLVAIPWVGFIIVPLGLLTTLLGYWFVLPWLLSILQHAITYLLYYLSWVDSFSLLNLTHSFNQIVSPLAWIIAMGVMIALPIRPLIPVIIMLIIAGSFPHKDKVLEGAVQVDVLDVGQGLSVVVRTKNHILIYDTGIQFYHGTDMGKLVIIPYLNSLGIETLDSVIISHPDLDHRGGLRSLQVRYNIQELIVDDPAFYHQGNSCHQHPDWVWDGVTFHFFPLTKMQKSKNNTSCVLKISNPYGQVLLTGDIEKSAENELIKAYGTQLKSLFIIVPHHGSKTSSSSAFLSEVTAKYAIVSYGFDNRYHFPHQVAMRAYQKRDTTVYNTVDCGMTSIILGKKEPYKPTCYRH